MLSLCLIVRDEEKNLRNLLPVLMEHDVEICVVDTGSTDKTVSLLQSSKIILKEMQWNNDFSYARNESLKLASKDWILWIDADDQLDAKTLKNILNWLPTADRVPYTFEIQNPREDGPGENFKQLRLFPNHKEIFFTGKIHESLLPSISEKKQIVQEAPFALIHTGYKTTELRLQKAQRNLTILEEEAISQNDSTVWMELGNTYYIIKEFEKAMDAYEKGMDANGPKEVQIANIALLGQVHFEKKDYPVAEIYLSKSIELGTQQHAPYYHLAQIQKEKNDFKEMSDLFEQMLSLPDKPGLLAENRTPMRLNAYATLGLMAWGKKEAKKAKEYLLKAQHPDFDLPFDSSVLAEIEKTLEKKSEKLKPSDINAMLGTIKKPLKALGKNNTLSVCMIVKNEEANIEAAIRSFLPFADEIIVNDTGSTDETLAILSRFPVKIIQSEWKDDFAYSRNISLEEATSSWVIWMDADDRVPADQVEEIKKLKTAPLDRCFGFQVINTQSGQPIGTRFYQTRMFPNHPQIRFERAIHEQIIFSIAKLGLHSFFVETAVWHVGYEDPKQKKRKALRNLALLEKDDDRFTDPIVPMQEGDSWSIVEEWDKAIEAYNRAYNISGIESINPDAYREIPNQIARAYQMMGQFEKALDWLEVSLSKSKVKVEPFYYKAEILIKLGRKEEAIVVLREALSLERTHSGVSNQYDIIRIYAFNHLWLLLSEKKEHVEALEVAEKYYDSYPQVIEAQLDLARSLLSNGKAKESLSYFKMALDKFPEADRSIWLAYESAQDLAEKKAVNLSICLIVKNEEQNIKKCLDSIAALHADLIVVDTGSTDRTKDIARECRARVFDFPWVDDFAAARNYSLEQANGTWILWLDADDVLQSTELLKIQKLCQEIPNKAFGFMIKNSIDGGKSGSVFNQIRMIPNSPSIRFEGAVHEQLMPSLQRSNLPVEFTRLQILHTGYLNDEIVAEKQKRNLDILLRLPRKSAVQCYSIAGAYADLKEFKDAIVWYEKAFELAQERGEDPHVLEIALFKISSSWANLGEFSQAAAVLKEARKKYPLNAEGILLQAQLHKQANLEHEAILFYAKLLAFEENTTFIPLDFQQMKIEACQYLADSFQKRGKVKLGVDILKLGLSMYENQVPTAKMALDYFGEAEEYSCCESLLEVELDIEARAETFLLLGKVLVLTKKPKKALKVLQKGVDIFPVNKELIDLLALLQRDIAEKESSLHKS